MKLWVLLIILMSVATLVIMSSLWFIQTRVEASQDETSEPLRVEYVPGEVLVEFYSPIGAGDVIDLAKHNAKDKRIQRLAIKGVKRIEKSSRAPFHTLHLRRTNKEDVLVLVDELKKDPSVKSVSPNYFYRATTIPNDPLFTDQWYLQGHDELGINAKEAWDITTGNSLVTAVIDTGVYTSHPDLASRLYVNPGEDGLDNLGRNKRFNEIDDDGNGYVDDWQGWDTTTCDYYDEYLGICSEPKNPGNNIHDSSIGHGTHVAGILAATGNNGVGITGVNWETKILPIKVLNSQGIGTCAGVVNGIYYAMSMAKVANMSLGGSLCENMETAINYAVHTKQMVIVAAAGNENTGFESYPAAFDRVIAVGATDSTGGKASFSNFGSWVDIMAPGSHLLSTFIPGFVFNQSCGDPDNDGYAACSGTSMSSPVVAGVAGLVLAKNPSLTPSEVLYVLQNSAFDMPPYGKDIWTSYGIVDAGKAVMEMNTEAPPIIGINWPVEDSPVSGKVVIEGKVSLNDFSHYTIDYASLTNPNYWMTDGISLTTPNNQVEQGVLGYWDTNGLPENAYILKLAAYTLSSKQYISTTTVRMHRALNGQWPAKMNEFTGESFVLADLNGDDSLEVVIQDKIGVNVISHNGDMLPGWPVQGLTLPALHLSVGMVANHRDVITRYIQVQDWPEQHINNITALSPSGNTNPGWPKIVHGSSYYNQTVADLNLNGKQEVIAMECINGDVLVEKLRIYRHDGSVFPGFEDVTVNAAAGMCGRGTPIVGDINNDGYSEIIVDFYDGVYPTGQFAVAAYNRFGERLWKFLIPSNNGESIYWGNYVVLGDLDMDQKDEVIFSVGVEQSYLRQLVLYVLDEAGRMVEPFSPLATGINDLSAPLILADMNGDLYPEIFINDFMIGTYSAIDFKGQTLPGFPVETADTFRCNFNNIIRTIDGKTMLACSGKYNLRVISDKGKQWFSALVDYDFETGKFEIDERTRRTYGYHSAPFYVLADDIDRDGNIELISLVGYENSLDNYVYVEELDVKLGWVEWGSRGYDARATFGYVQPLIKRSDINSSYGIDLADLRGFNLLNPGYCGSKMDVDGNCYHDIFDANLLYRHFGRLY